jgi:hypothetical protein
LPIIYKTPRKSSKGYFYRVTHNKSLTATYTFPEYQLNYDKIGTEQNPWFRNGQGNEMFQQGPLDINVGALENDPAYYKDLYYEASVNYNRAFGKHHVSGLALVNRQQRDKTTQFPCYNQGLVGRGTYDFAGKYMVEVNIGYTGSERFAPVTGMGSSRRGLLVTCFRRKSSSKIRCHG